MKWESTEGGRLRAPRGDRAPHAGVRVTRIALLLGGAALFAWLLTQAELAAVLTQVAAVGVAGFALLLAVYAVEFLCDAFAWQLTLDGTPRTARWTARLYAVRLAGECWNVLTPLGGIGGEPVKALILKRRYGLPFTASGASLVLAKTANVLSLVAFLAVGFVVMSDDPRIPAEARTLSGVGLALLSAGIGAFWLVQRLRLGSLLASRAARRHPRLTRALTAMQDLDRRLVTFYSTSPGRLALVLALGMANWMLGALGVWLTLTLMGVPATFQDAWIIEAVAQMVRAATFFIPASLGAQDGAVMLIAGAITGDAGSGLAVALLRRARELVWILAGLAASARLTAGAPLTRGTLRAGD